MLKKMEKTLANKISLSGTGLHSGTEATVSLLPSQSGGIVFKRTDIGVTIPARHTNVSQDDLLLSTVLKHEHGRIGTVEHVLSAISGMEIDHAVILVNGPEIPILDGSSWSFAMAIQEAGITELSSHAVRYEIVKTFEYTEGDKYFCATPGANMFVDYSVDFGKNFVQNCRMTISREKYLDNISRAKTFCREVDLYKIRAAGMAKGGNRTNALILGEDRVLNHEQQSYENELARHKILDFIGDMSLLGGKLHGTFRIHKGGHKFHNDCLRKMLANNIICKKKTDNEIEELPLWLYPVAAYG